MALQNTLIVLSILTSVLGISAVLLRTGQQFGSLRSDLEGFKGETLRRFEQVDRRFSDLSTGMDARFDRVDVRLDRVDVRLGRVEDRLGRVEDRLTGVAVDVARIGQKLDDHVLDPRAHQSAAR